MSRCFSGWAVLFRYPAESFFFIVLSIGFPTQLSKKNIEGIVSVTVEECSPVSRAALIRFPVYAFLLFDATEFQLNYVKYVRGMSTGGAAAELFITYVHRYFRGRMFACHVGLPCSIPGCSIFIVLCIVFPTVLSKKYMVVSASLVQWKNVRQPRGCPVIASRSLHFYCLIQRYSN